MSALRLQWRVLEILSGLLAVGFAPHACFLIKIKAQQSLRRGFMIFGILALHWRRTITACVALICLAQVVVAHEVLPAIGDLTIENGGVVLDISLNAEAIVAGVDLEGVDDTNDTILSREVDALRLLQPEELSERIRVMAPFIVSVIEFYADGQIVPLQLTGINVPDVGDSAQPRESQLTFEASVATATGQVSLKWPAEFGTLILRQQGVSDPYTGYLSGGSSGPISVLGGEGQNGLQTFTQYIPVGFDHILPKGLDHILFVMGLFFLVPRLHALLWQITAFTLAHSITLALAAQGYIIVPGSIVEPLIAASIVYVAIENLANEKITKLRPLVIFGFGLLHGLGFASVLSEFGLPQGLFVPALIGFNVGVEVGQITVLLGLFMLTAPILLVENGKIPAKMGFGLYLVSTVVLIALRFVLDSQAFVTRIGTPPEVFLVPLAALSGLCALACWFSQSRKSTYRRYVSAPASIGIGLVGSFWFIERVFL